MAAIRAGQLGLKTAIVERENLGGICLNWGCIPTKALLKTGELYEGLEHLADYGLAIEGRSYDFARVIQRSRDVAKQLSSGVAFLMKKYKATVIDGVARLEPGPNAPRVVVEEKGGATRVLEATSVILATGARARTIPVDRPRAGRREGLDLSRGDDAQDAAGEPGGHRLGRDRHRIRQLLQGSGLRSHGRGGAARGSCRWRTSRSPRRRARPTRRAASPSAPAPRSSDWRRPGGRRRRPGDGWQDARGWRPKAPSSRSASRPTSRTSASRRWGSRSTADMWSSPNPGRPM